MGAAQLFFTNLTNKIFCLYSHEVANTLLCPLSDSCHCCLDKRSWRIVVLIRKSRSNIFARSEAVAGTAKPDSQHDLWQVSACLWYDQEQSRARLLQEKNVLMWKKIGQIVECVGTSASTLKSAAGGNVWMLHLTKDTAAGAITSAKRVSFAFMGCAAMHEIYTLFTIRTFNL